MTTLGNIFDSEFQMRITTLSEILPALPKNQAVVLLELHRLQVAARAAGESQLEDCAERLETALKAGSVPSIEVFSSETKVKELLEVFGLKPSLREIPEPVSKAFALEFENRSSSLQALFVQLRGNDATIRSKTLLETHRLRVASLSAKHQLESPLRALERILEQPQMDGLEDWLKTQTDQLFTGLKSSKTPSPQNPVWQTPTPQIPTSPTLFGSIDALSPRTTEANTNDNVRVSVQRLDTLLAQAGELTISRIRLENRAGEIRQLLVTLQASRKHFQTTNILRHRLEKQADPQNEDLQELLGFFDQVSKQNLQNQQQLENILLELSQDTAQLKTVNTIIEDEVLSVRLLPAANLFANLERLVRDLSKTLGKNARFESAGGEIGLDRKILEGLRDPLMHMVRNSLDHGLENPESRSLAGKPETGTVKLEVRQSGATIEITLHDDGAGINLKQIQKVAFERGLIAENTVLDDTQTLELLFAPGFSTASSVTETSGRGVGMDVVRENIRALGGSISLESQPGFGSSFKLRLPATLATSRVLLVRVKDVSLAIPTSYVERVARVRITDVVQLEGQQAVILEGRAVPIIELGSLLEISNTPETNEWRVFVVLASQTNKVAVIVSALLGEQEIVIKKLGYPLQNTVHLQGAAILGTGVLVPILNGEEIIRKSLTSQNSSKLILNTPKPKAKTRILVVDDSITTRTLERTILESAGFETRTAINGLEALKVLRAEEIQLVLSDVEMPLMDGFTLTGEIRQDERLKHIPVILVTSLNAPEHKQRGAQAGADAYIIKGEFDQGKLLEKVRALL